MTQATLSDTPDESLEGTVERVVFVNPENGWAVIRFQPSSRPGRSRIETIVGRIPEVRAGERLRLSGNWVEDPRFGRQFRASSHVRLAPQTLRGLEAYLGSGLVPGIGPTMAKRMVAKFELDTLRIIEDEPERLSEVEGIGPVRAGGIRDAWGQQKSLRDALIFLNSYGVSGALAGRIYARYGEETVAKVRSNPYLLATDVHGIGFRTADQIAVSLGVSLESPERAAAGVLFALGKASEQGHLFLPRKHLIRDTRQLLEIGEDLIVEAIERLLREELLVSQRAQDDSQEIYRADFLRAETLVADRVRELMAAPAAPVRLEIEQAIAWFERGHDLTLAPQQRRAVAQSVTEKILVLTGGPGTGKTTLVRAIVEIMQRKGVRILLAAPTGRAANRLAETTGTEAKTIHRMLEFDPGRRVFQRQAEHPLEADLVILDEASMIDCILASHLLPALPDSCRLILVGDVDQLPSVGPGLFLADLIVSQAVPVVRLDEIFRQAARSSIVANAHRIRRGSSPKIDRNDPQSDFFFFERPTPEEVRSTVLDLVTKRIPDGFALSPMNDIQVLTPMKKGIIGAEGLNLDLQERLNPAGDRIGDLRRGIRDGDRVMQIRNNYGLEVFNGEIGRAHATAKSGELRVEFGDRDVHYEAKFLDELALAYACTVHKSQGSEYPCIVMPIHTQHYMMLQRNLLYTAVTRARRLAILVGSRKALDMAVGNDRIARRYTSLAERLRRP